MVSITSVTKSWTAVILYVDDRYVYYVNVVSDKTNNQYNTEVIKREIIAYINYCNCFTFNYTNSMEQSPPERRIAYLLVWSKILRLLLRNQKNNYSVHKKQFWFKLIQIISILILSSSLRPGLSSGLFPSTFPTKILYTFLISRMRATCPTNLILFGHPINAFWKM
jgi:hypothetical protein